jgi:hypothetical protein
MPEHFWIGSFCLAGQRFPPNVTAIADTMSIQQDMGNKIPDKSWMLYLLELFDNNIPIELNLICQYNDRDNFWAIFRGVNRYKFTKVLPQVGHSYARRIVMDRAGRSIHYSVTDRNTGEAESHSFQVSEPLAYRGSNHFTGVEWWNKAGSSPFPARYRVEISNLEYGIQDGEMTYRQYDRLAPNGDGTGASYPISFEVTKARRISYIVASGKTVAGMKFAAA